MSQNDREIRFRRNFFGKRIVESIPRKRSRYFFEELVEGVGFSGVGKFFNIGSGKRFIARRGCKRNTFKPKIREEVVNIVGDTCVFGRIYNQNDGFFLANLFFAEIAIVFGKNVFCRCADLFIISGARHEGEHVLSVLEGDVGDAKQTFFFPRVDHEGVYIGGVDIANKREKTFDFFERKVGANVVLNGPEKGIDGEGIENCSQGECFVFNCLNNLLLSFGATKIATRIVVSFANVFQRGCSVERMKTFCEGEMFVGIVGAGIAGVVKILRNSNIDAAERIHYLHKAVIIDNKGIVYRKSGNGFYGGSNGGERIVVIFLSVRIQGVEFCFCIHPRNIDIKIAR